MAHENYKTRVLGINLSDDVYNFLIEEGMDVSYGVYGPKIDACGKFETNSYLPISNRIALPDNLHEYDVIIEDMHHTQVEEYLPQKNKSRALLSDDREDSIISLIIHRPQNQYDPVPLGCFYVSQDLRMKSGPIIKINFQEKFYEANYKGVSSDRYIRSFATFSNYQYLEKFCKEGINGNKIKLTEYQLSYDLFEGLTDEMSYVQTYFHPRMPDNNLSKDFIPLLTNDQGDIISYIYFNNSNGNVSIMLPQLKDKLKLLKRLFYKFLYKYESEFFPMQTANAWLSNEEYELLEVIKLKQDKENIRQKAEKEIEAKDNEIKACHDKLAFLYGMLTGTGDDLVNDVVTYLKWLGFDDVRKADDDVEESGLLQEDIQVRLPDNDLLIIEVKGVHGTSTDNECGQIEKNVLRRIREHKNINVYGLYIVNNEMGKEPLKRTFPPFNETQIKDAENSTRGLAYTYQLFNLYFEIESGIITKEEAQKSLLDYGLVDFRKNLKSLGVPYKYIKQNTIICLEIQNTEIKIGDFFYFEDGRKRLQKVQIKSIEQEGKPLTSVDNGKTGFGLDKAVPNGVEMLIKTE